MALDTSDRLFRFVLYSVVAVIAVYVLVVAKSILLPLVIAIVIAYLILALSESFGDIPVIGDRIPKWLAFVLALLSVAVAMTFLLNLIINNVEQVIAKSPEYEKSLTALIEQVAVILRLESIPTIAQLVENIDMAAMFRLTLDPLRSVAGNVFLIIFYVSFLLLERATIQQKMSALISDQAGLKNFENTISQIEHKIRKYVGIKIFVSFLTAGFSYIVMAYIGIDFAAFWAVLIFLMNFIPYVGSIIAVTFPVVLTLLQFNSFQTFLLALGLLVGVQVLVANVVEPRVMGESLNLSPLMILLALAAWGSIWGIVGMIICIPMMVIAMIVFSQFPNTKGIAILMSQSGEIETV